jgi:hypothetical protein
MTKNQDLRFAPRAALEQSNERTTKQFEQLDQNVFASLKSVQGAEVPDKLVSRRGMIWRCPACAAAGSRIPGEVDARGCG